MNINAPLSIRRRMGLEIFRRLEMSVRKSIS